MTPFLGYGGEDTRVALASQPISLVLHVSLLGEVDFDLMPAILLLESGRQSLLFSPFCD